MFVFKIVSKLATLEYYQLLILFCVAPLSSVHLFITINDSFYA